MTDEQRLADAGLKLVTRTEVDAATDIPDFVREIIKRCLDIGNDRFVIYLPNDNSTYWVMVGNRAEIVADAIGLLNSADNQERPQASLF